jgi:hypothetical protein
MHYARYVVNVVDSWSLGRFGSSTLSSSFGEYLQGSNLTPIDLFHFSGNRTSIFQTQQQYGLSYQLLDYYSHSTAESFAGANFNHDFHSLVFAKISFLKKIGLKSYLMANLLQVKDLATYSELGFGLSLTYLPIRLNYHLWFQGNQQVTNGFTLVIKP